MATILFWSCTLAATYSYFWYPIILLTLRPRQKGCQNRNYRSKATRIAIVIAARNEAKHIAAKLDNCLTLQSANIELDIIVASDASDDSTDEITRRYATRGVQLVRAETRQGKEHAQGLATAATNAEVLIFTDASVQLLPDTLSRVLDAFEDPSVGAVSSVDQIITEQGTPEGEGAYVRYEMWLRDLETQFYSLVGLSGSFFVARRSVCTNWDSRVPSDFGIAMNCVFAGLRAVSDRNIVGRYKSLAAPQQEYRRKLRTINRGINGLLIRHQALNFCKFPRFAFEVFSHKLMRWAVPWFLLTALGASAFLALHSSVYRALLLAQVALYSVPSLCKALPQLHRIKIVALAAFFVKTNIAILHATVLALSGKRIAFWEPSIR